MLGLIRKDLYNLSGSMKLYLVMPALFAFLGFMNNDLSMLAFGTSFLSVFIVISSCAYDDMSQFQPFALTLPISRKDLVLSKFLMGNIFSIVLYIVCNIAANVLFMIFGTSQFPEFQAMEFAMVSIVAVMAANICISVLLSVIFKFGTEKGRIVFMMIFLGIGLLGGLLGTLNIDLPIDFLMNLSDTTFFIIITLVSILAEGISIVISNHVMAHKEI